VRLNGYAFSWSFDHELGLDHSSNYHLLSVTLAAFGVLEYRTWEQQRPCRAWKSSHDPGQSLAQEPDGVISFDPCNLWREMPWIDKALALIGFSSSVAFLVSLIQDVVPWWVRRRNR
jgi:hypothetical protein